MPVWHEQEAGQKQWWVRDSEVTGVTLGGKSGAGAEGEREAEVEGEAGGVPLTITPPLDEH